MKSFDGNSDNEISLTEFLEFLGKTQEVTEAFEGEEWKESGELAFKVYDKDTNGILDHQ